MHMKTTTSASPRAHLAFLSLLTLSSSLALADVPQAWTITVLARDGRTTSQNLLPDAALSQSGIFNEPAIDSSGRIAIRYTHQNSTPNKLDAFFLYDPATGQSSSILTTTPPVLYSGKLDFHAGNLLILEQGLFAQADRRSTSGQLLSTLTLGGPLQVTGLLTSPTQTNTNATLYRASASGNVHYLVDRTNPDDGVRTQISLANSTSTSPFSALGVPAINRAGTLAGRVTYPATPTNYGVVLFSENQSPQTRFDMLASGYDGLQESLAINNQGQVAFFARRPGSAPTFTPQWELLRSNADGSQTSIAQAGSMYTNAGFGNYLPKINDQGHIAFRAEKLTGPDAGIGLFVGDGTSTVRIIADRATVTLPSGQTATLGVGQPTARTVFVGTHVFRDNKLVFPARLSDNTHALILATPLAPASCGPADLGGEGGSQGPDNILDNNDFIVFINYFFANDPRADFGREGGDQGSDGLFDNNDFIVFIQFFFS
jgi:hypothetical protein